MVAHYLRRGLAGVSALTKLHTKVCIIGSGPAAHTAALYTARACLQPLLLEGRISDFPPPGGQLTTTVDVENYPGFPNGIGGIELMEVMKEQSEKFGTIILKEAAESVNLKANPYIVRTMESEIKCDSIIVATGALARRLDFPGSDKYWNRGISACAVCDGAVPIFRNGKLFVIGGGDSAMEEALFLSKYGSQVFVVHRRNELRASRILQDRVRENEKIELILNHVVEEAVGNDKLLSEIVLRSTTPDAKLTRMEANGIFFAVGHIPATNFLKNSGIAMDEDGYVLTDPGSTETNVNGVFACGDVTDRIYRQAITAAGSGCMAALDAERYLQKIG